MHNKEAGRQGHDRDNQYRDERAGREDYNRHLGLGRQDNNFIQGRGRGGATPLKVIENEKVA